MQQKQTLQTQHMKLTAYNFLQSSNTSIYSLLCKETRTARLEWLTLRIVDHPFWLQNAQQISIDIGSPTNLVHLLSKIKKLFASVSIDDYFYKLSAEELAILQLIDECQQNGLVWAVSLPVKIFQILHFPEIILCGST